ncbi:hypothetical protein CR513_34261, partial [Mucuna pruriens]
MILVEIGESSPKIALFEPVANEEELRAKLDLLQEVREIAHIKEYAAKARVARRFGQKVIHRDFKVKDLVLRKITLGTEKNKLTPKREGPFKVVERVGKGAYRLEHLDGHRISRTWNAGFEDIKLQDLKQTAIETDSGSEEIKLQDPKRAAIETDPGYEEIKLQDPKRTTIETDPRSEEIKLQDLKRTTIETDPGSEEIQLQDPKRTAIETDPGFEE